MMSLFLSFLLLFQMWPNPGPGRAAYGGGGGGGDITWTELTEGSDTTTNPSTTAQISPAANSVVYVTVGVAITGGTTIDSDSVTVSGCSISNWSTVGRAHNSPGGDRRSIYVVRGSSASPGSNCSLTITFTSGGVGTWTESMWSVDQASNVNTTTPESTVTTNNNGSGTTSISVAIGTAPDAGDHVFAACGMEVGSISATLNGELSTFLTNLGGGTDVRTITVAYDSTPDATPNPGFNWTGSASVACVGFIVNKV